ncbi:MAG TPA: 16S rRNA (cytidine(1402)-2'-O)-methyltransferase [Gammaproteobacteria bacterium]|nr:16S rRNA (cytidine(1402)-2'-O)-methyltransferase [Gammaproteobacteria bacterium]
MSILPATLYVVATPLGNLADLGARAREILAAVDFIAAEDTRRTRRLLESCAIRSRLTALHEHNEETRTPALVARLARGESAALVSDAGTPLVSDPGYRLVRAAQDAGIAVRAVPGPCAAIAALSVAGLPSDRFAFEGFLPAKATARRGRLGALAKEPRTLIFYEAPHRLIATLEDCVRAFGEAREAALARELTKVHESLHRRRLGELSQLVGSGAEPALGECVLLVAGARKDPGEETGGAPSADEVLEALAAEGLGAKTAAAVAHRLTGKSRRDLYRRAIELARRVKTSKR